MRQFKISKTLLNRTACVDKYLNEIAKEKFITVEEEVELAKRIKKGDDRALEALVKANLRFVVSVAKQYQRQYRSQGLSLTELINEGNIGMIVAAKRFDETRGFKFISYAVWWIRQSIQIAIATQSRTIRLPYNQIGKIRKISESSSKFEQEYDRIPTPEEMSKFLDLSAEDIATAINDSHKNISLNTPIHESDGDSICLADVITGNDSSNFDTNLMRDSLKRDLNKTLSLVLSYDDQYIIRSYYGIDCDPKSVAEIAEVLSVSEATVRFRREKSLRKMKKNDGRLKAYRG